VKTALRWTLFKYKLHAEEELFEKVYGDIKQYYRGQQANRGRN
jgi:type I restriction enzyme R subunit